MKLQFIASSREEPPTSSWMFELAKHLDIEFVEDDEDIINSEKPCLLWNPVAKVVSNKFRWKDVLYKKLKDKGKTVYSVERGYLPDCLYIDKNGVLANSKSYEKKNWDRRLTSIQRKIVNTYIKKFISSETTLEEQGSKRLTQEEFYQKLNLSDELKIFIPLQKANDSVIKLWADWIRNIENFKDLVRELALEYPNIKFLVKSHPRRPKDKIKSHDNIINVDNLHYKDCIAYSDIILTINSGVGLQAMMWQKPVITVGKAFYQFDCINSHATSKEEVIKLIKELKQPSMEKVKKFIHFLKYNFYTDCEMKDLQPVKINRIVIEHPTKNQNIIIIPK